MLKLARSCIAFPGLEMKKGLNPEGISWWTEYSFAIDVLALGIIEVYFHGYKRSRGEYYILQF